METIRLDWRNVYASSLKFLLPLNPQQTYKTVVREAVRLLEADEGTIIMYKNKRLVRVYTSYAALKEYEVKPFGRTYHALKTGEPFVSIVKNENDIQKPLYERGFKTIIFIPLAYGAKTKGVLNIFDSDKKRINQSTALKLQMFGAMISEALYKAEQYEKTEEAIVARDMFIAMASHELRNPLTSIMITAQLIKKTREGGKIPDTRFIDSIVTQSLWMSKLLDETLAMRNLKKHSLRKISGPISLLDVIHLAVTSFKVSHNTYQIALQEKINKTDSLVVADFYKLLQVFMNVLNNAAKFSSSEKLITIKIGYNNSYIITQIIDKGIGIAKKDLPKIFEGFYQGGKKDREGLGLGLYLVKRIVEDASGKIEIKSKENYGTTVSILLPRYAIPRTT